MTAAAGIPGVPTAALDAIPDENTRMVLRAIVDGWQVRNGNTGKGDNRFVTAGELGSVTGARMIGGLSQTLQQEIGKQTLTPGEIGRVITDLQAAIMESALWKDLGERVTIIDAGVGVAINDEQIKRLNDDNALVSAINTMWASIGDNAALVQRGATGIVNTAGATAIAWQQVQSTIRDPITNAYISSAVVKTTADTAVNKAGELEGKYTVKVDLNGYVSGFGLASTANNSTPFSEFIVRADRFAIGTPSVPDYAQYVDNYLDILNAWNIAGQPDKEIFGYNHYVPQGQNEGRVVPNKLEETVPFIVTTTPQTVNGKVAPPGVYMDNAFIRNGSIANAMIGLAQIDTLVLQGNAVTVSTYDDAYLAEFLLTTTPVPLCSTTVTIPALPTGATAGTIIVANATYYEAGGANTAVVLEILFYGDVIASGACTLGESKTVTVTGFANVPQGTKTISSQISVSTGGGLWPSTKQMTVIGGLVVMSGKR